MGSLSLYAVSFEALAAARGSADEGLVRSASRGLDDDVAEAVRELVFWTGGPLASAKHCLGYAEQALCEVLGRRLSSNSVSGTQLSRLEELDESLAEAGAPCTLSSVMYGGGPLGLPWPDDFPSSGKWTAEEVAKARADFHASPPTTEDEATDAILEEMEEWLDTAASIQWGIVGYYA